MPGLSGPRADSTFCPGDPPAAPTEGGAPAPAGDDADATAFAGFPAAGCGRSARGSPPDGPSAGAVADAATAPEAGAVELGFLGPSAPIDEEPATDVEDGATLLAGDADAADDGPVDPRSVGADGLVAEGADVLAAIPGSAVAPTGAEATVDGDDGAGWSGVGAAFADIDGARPPPIDDDGAASGIVDGDGSRPLKAEGEPLPTLGPTVAPRVAVVAAGGTGDRDWSRPAGAGSLAVATLDSGDVEVGGEAICEPGPVGAGLVIVGAADGGGGADATVAARSAAPGAGAAAGDVPGAPRAGAVDCEPGTGEDPMSADPAATPWLTLGAVEDERATDCPGAGPRSTSADEDAAALAESGGVPVDVPVAEELADEVTASARGVVLSISETRIGADGSRPAAEPLSARSTAAPVISVATGDNDAPDVPVRTREDGSPA